MTTAELLADLAGKGFTLAPEGDGVRVSPASRLTEDLRATIRAHRAELLALLRPWDPALADAALAACLARLGRALAVGGVVPTPARRRVVRVYREVVADLHAKRDPTLFEALDGIDALLARWRWAR